MQQDSNILQIDNLSKYFGGLAAVSDCSLKIKKGSITGIIGPNGSGKTTLFNLIAGNLKPNGGKVLFNNEDITFSKNKNEPVKLKYWVLKSSKNQETNEPTKKLKKSKKKGKKKKH